MTLTPSPLKQTLRSGGVVLGTMLTEWYSPSACRAVQLAGFEFVIFDTEHNRGGVESVSWVLRTGKDIGLPVIVRAPGFEGQWPTRYLDMGAAGNLFPRVETVDEMERLMRMIKYPPMGARGLGTGIGHDNYGGLQAAEFCPWSNDNLFVVVQLETEQGWANRDAIFAVPGIDACFIGPNDLALSLGLPGQLDHPRVQSAIADIFQSAEAHGVAAGIHGFSVANCLHYLEMGARFLAFSSELSLFLHASREGLAEVRKAAER